MKKSLLMLAAGVALSANVFSADAADLYLRGAVNGWGTSNQFETTDDDHYTLHLDKLTGGFKIADADWSADYNFGAGENAVVTPGVDFPVFNGSNTNITVEGELTDVTVNFTLSTTTLLIEAGGAGEVTYTYALHGTLASTTWAPVALTEGEAGVWTGSFVAGQAAGVFGVKQLNGTVQTSWIAGDGAQTINAENTTATLTDNGGENIAIEMAAGATYNATLDLNKMTVTIVANGEVPPVPVTYPETFYILGEVNGNGWAPDAGVAMENKGEGIFVAEGVQVDGYFSFTEVLAEAGDWSSLQRYGAATDGAEIALDAPLAFSKGDNAFKVFEAGTYDMQVDFATMTVTLLKAGAVGVEAIEVEAGEAVYYNLCGVRVANPENGIFVKVVDGKATKVVK